MKKRKAASRTSSVSAPKRATGEPPEKSLSVFHDWDKAPNPPRIGRQTDQELISKSALVNWLYRYEWKSNKPEIDLGQDLWVEIYENRRSTGLSVNVQHKSAENIDAYKLKASPQISYPVDVKDLLHWNKQLVPVILIICDLHREDERYWIFISDVIAELEKTDSTWLHQESTQAVLPLINRLTADALPIIRHRLADHFYPVLAQRYKGIKIGMKFSFPATPAGQSKNAALMQFLDTGQPVTIEKKYIADFRLSDWHEQLYGRQIPDQLTFGKSSSRAVYQFRVEIYTQDGSVVPAQTLELRMLQSGRRESTLTNGHQKQPLVFTFTLMNYPDRHFVQVNFKLVHAGNTVFETRDALLFLIAAAEGGQVQVIETSSGKSVSAGVLETDEHFSIDQLKAQAELVKKLCFFQSRFRFSPVLSVRGKYLTDDDYYPAHKLYTICQTGLFSGPREMTFTLDRVKISENTPNWEELLTKTPEQGMEMEMTIPESMTVLGRVIEFGNVCNTAKFSINQTISYQEQIRRGLKRKLSDIKIAISDVDMNFKYVNWNRDDSMFGFKIASKQTRRTSGAKRKLK